MSQTGQSSGSPLPALPTRTTDAHKNACGRVLVIAGSPGMTGAGVLASRAALRSGAGLVTWALPQSLSCWADFIAPEFMTLGMPETAQRNIGLAAREHLLEAAREANAVILGPGLSVAGETGELMRLLIPEISQPLLLDAGALRALGEEQRLLTLRRAPTVLTPHPGEMAELCGKTTSEIQQARRDTAREYAAATQTILLLKGAGSVISDGKTEFVNSTGNPGMATAGAGDVLCGVIAALLAQGLSAFDAARLGAYLHGRAGDLACEEKGVHGLLAGDIIEALPAAFLEYARTGGMTGEI